MLCLISILGGLLIMMGQHDRSKALFYYFRIEIRFLKTTFYISSTASFDFVREKLLASYSETGRSSIDPEVLLRIVFEVAQGLRHPSRT